VARKQTYRQRHGLQHTGESGAPAERLKAREDIRQVCSDGQVILIDKPVHWTSFDVVRKLRGFLQIKKIGHAGTLDPLASGLLIVCTGAFTKRINEFMKQEKEYTGSFTLGAVTPTYDLESKPEHFRDISQLTEADIRNACHRFIGNIAQFPPLYSAIKKEGTPLYELARRGESVELEARAINISEMEITGIELPLVYFRVVCSTGTYIRSLAHDYGQALGCGAYLSALRRTRIGDNRVEQAQTPARLMDAWKELPAEGRSGNELPHQNG